MDYEIALKELPNQPVVSCRGVTTMAELSRTVGDLVGAVWGHLQKHGVAPVGPPFTRYHRVAGGEIELEGGFPVAAPVPGEGRVQSGSLPGGEALSTNHFGGYESLPGAGEALEAWRAQHGRVAAEPNWEIYWAGPGTEKDPSKWRTEVVMPLARR